MVREWWLAILLYITNLGDLVATRARGRGTRGVRGGGGGGGGGSRGRGRGSGGPRGV